MTALTADALVTSGDRLSLTLCLAILLHAILILGVSFIPPLAEIPSYETMEIVLVNSRSEEEPEEAPLLAQAQQVGGGEEDEDVRPATPLVMPIPTAVPAVPLALNTAPQPPAPSVEPQTAASEALPGPPAEAPALEAEADETASATQELVAEAVEELDRQLRKPAVEPEANRQDEPVVKAEEKPVDEPAEQPVAVIEEAEIEAQPTPPAPTGAALIARSFEIASLDAEIAERMEAKAKRPRRKFISATTAEYKYAAYMEAWRAKVERIGNLNYPDEARRDKLSGSLILDVALKADGSLSEITVRRPSGFPVLDDAAIRIVELAAPYAAFPDEFRKDVDILHITRTWQFKSGARFASQ